MSDYDYFPTIAIVMTLVVMIGSAIFHAFC